MVTARFVLMKGMHMYKIETQLSGTWYCLHFDVDDGGTSHAKTYNTLEDTTRALEKYIDDLFLVNQASSRFGVDVMPKQVPYNSFRIVKV